MATATPKLSAATDGEPRPRRKPSHSISLGDRLMLGIAAGQVVSLYDAQIELGERWQQASRALIELVNRGIFARLGEQLWVRLGRDPDPYKVGARITFPYAFASTTALALHTRDPAVPSEILLASVEPFEPFSFAGVSYRRVAPWCPDEVVQLRAKGQPNWLARVTRDYRRAPLGPGEHYRVPERETVWVTSVERTLTACLRGPAQALDPTVLLDLDASLTSTDAQTTLRRLQDAGAFDATHSQLTPAANTMTLARTATGAP